jgi:Exocyst complex component Sec5
MDQQVMALDGKMNEITNSILKISSGLDEKRKNVQQLTKVSELLKKLDFIIGMPTTLSQLLESKKYSEAVLFYSKANSVLQKYKSTMFSQIQIECQDVLKHVGIKIQNRVFSGTGNVLQISEGIGMLVALETIPPSDLAKQFVYKVSDMIDKVLIMFKNRFRYTDRLGFRITEICKLD